MSTTRAFRRHVLLVAAAGFALRAWHVAALEGTAFASVLVGDALRYDAWARELAAGAWRGGDVFYQAPLYPYLVGVVYAVAGADPALVRAVQVVLGAASVALLAIGTRHFFGPAAALAAATLLALHPPAIFAAGLLQKSALDLFLFTAFLAHLGPGGIVHGRKGAASAGMVLGALCLTRENALLLVPAAAVYAGRGADGRGRALRSLLLLAGVAAVLLPVAWRNHSLGGGFLPTTSQAGSNFYIGNHAGADGRYVPLRRGRGAAEFEAADARALAEAARGRPLSPPEVSAFWFGESGRWIVEHPAAWARLLLRKAALVVNAREVPDTDALEAHRDVSPALAATRPFGFGLVFVLATVGAVVGRRDWRRWWPLGALAAAWAVSVVAFFVLGRYRLPLGVTLLPLAGEAVRRLLELRDWPPRERRLAGTGAVLALVVTSWPLGRADPRAVNLGAIGVELAEDGNDARATDWLERAVAASPTLVDARVVLATVHLRRGKTTAARVELEEAVRLAPSHVQARHNLGVLLAMLGDVASAVGHLRHVVALDPGHVDGWVNLARATAESGDLAGAEAAVLRALSLRPADAGARELHDQIVRPGDRHGGEP